MLSFVHNHQIQYTILPVLFSTVFLSGYILFPLVTSVTFPLSYLAFLFLLMSYFVVYVGNNILIAIKNLTKVGDSDILHATF